MSTHGAERNKWDVYYSTLPLVEPDEATCLFNSALTLAVKELLPDGGRVLEAGCGGGWQSLALAEEGNFEVTLLDFSAEALRYAERVFQARGRNVELIHGDAFESGTERFDLVFNAGVLEHYTVADQTRMVRAMASQSRNYVLALVPNQECYWYWLWRARLSAAMDWKWGKEVPRSNLANVLSGAGLVCAGHAYFGESWTRHFLKVVLGENSKAAQEMLEIHDSSIIPLSHRAYLVGALGAKKKERVPARWRNTNVVRDENAAMQAALSDAVALRLAGERRLIEIEADAERLRLDAKETEARTRAESLLQRTAIEEATAEGGRDRTVATEAVTHAKAESQFLRVAIDDARAEAGRERTTATEAVARAQAESQFLRIAIEDARAEGGRERLAREEAESRTQARFEEIQIAANTALAEACLRHGKELEAVKNLAALQVVDFTRRATALRNSSELAEIAASAARREADLVREDYVDMRYAAEKAIGELEIARYEMTTIQGAIHDLATAAEVRELEIERLTEEMERTRRAAAGADAISNENLAEAARKLRTTEERFTSESRNLQRQLCEMQTELANALDRGLQLQHKAESLLAEAASERNRRERAEEMIGETQRRLRLALDQAERLRQAGAAGFERSVGKLNEALEIYRSQRAWTLMIVIREMYSRWVRGGASGKWKALGLPFRLMTGAYVVDADFDPAFPDPLHDLPAIFESPVTETALTPPKRQAAFDCIFLPIFDFEFRHQRPQQIAVSLALQHHHVFWISPSRPCSTGPGTYELVQLRPNLWEVRVPGAPFDLYGGTLTETMVEALLPSFERLFEDFAISESAVVTQFPFWRRLALDLRNKFSSRLAYDLMDDWRNWTTEPLISEFALRQEEKFVSECDVLVVTAAEFMKRYGDNQPQPLLVPNGADYDFFAGQSHAAKRLLDFRTPIIGYYGAISTWFDLELMTEVARSRPEYTFVLIGAVHKVDVRQLKALPNVKLLGEKNYRELPPYLAAFDVCLIPFRINTLTKAVDPVKFYEYLSQAKPVVSTPLFELLPHRQLLYLAHGPVEFAAAIDLALKEDKSDANIREPRLTFARSNSWSERANRVERSLSHAFPLVSILVVTYNSAEFIHPFVESLIAETSYPNFEVICVDNCSSDNSMALLAGWAKHDSRFHLERAPANLGFAGGNNLAARRAKGDYLVFLNPDTILTRGWLGRLIEPLWRDSTIGMTAPVTNFSGNQTKIDWNYRGIAGLREFAEERARKFRGQLMEVPVAPLLCGALSRSLWETVGELDVSFEVGMFEDDDFSVRIKKAGYRIVTAEDCYIHHFGNGSFSQLSGEENHRIFEHNRRRFEKKWGMKWNPHQHREGVTSLAHDRRLSVAEMATESEEKPILTPVVTMRIVSLHPAICAAGDSINPQPDATSSLAISCENATPDTSVEFDGFLLTTSYGSAGMISGTIPDELLERTGTFEVRLANALERSDPALFTITERPRI